MKKTIGIDLGHCETAAGYLEPVKGNSKKEYEVAKLKLDSSKDPICHTQIILSYKQMEWLSGKTKPMFGDLQKLEEEHGEIQVGSDLSAFLEEGELFLYFKRPPKDFNTVIAGSKAAKQYGITHGLLMACFIYKVIQNLLKYNDTQFSKNDRKDMRLLVGCPSTADWTDARAQNEYARLVSRATGVDDVQIIPESRAAMFSSMENKNHAISAVRGAVVFDFGSSTADCTYMWMGRDMLEFSWTLGAYEIERQMTHSFLFQCIQENGEFEPTERSMTEIENDLRRTKERFYIGGFGTKKKPIIVSFEDKAETDGSTKDMVIAIGSEYMDKITCQMPVSIRRDSKNLETKPWRQLCREFFLEAKKRIMIDAKYPIDSIVLTGGASRMGFIQELCKEVFEDNKIFVEENPSYTVSNGLAWVAVSDAKFGDCIEEVKRIISEDPICGIDKLKADVGDAAFNALRSIVEKNAKMWQEAPNTTYNDLNEIFQGIPADSETKKQIEAVCRKAIDGWKNNLSAVIMKAVNKQVKELYSEEVAKGLLLSDDIWRDLQFDNIGIDVNVANIIDKIHLTPFIASVLSFLGLFGSKLSEIARNYREKKMQEVRTAEQKKEDVQKVMRQVDTGKSECLKGCFTEFETFAGKYDAMMDALLKDLFEVVMLKKFKYGNRGR